jgi:hypothetical protein
MDERYEDEDAYTSEPDLEEGAGDPDDPGRFVADPSVSPVDEGPDDTVPRTHGGELGEAPDPPNELEGPDPEPPHLQEGSPHEGAYPNEDPAPGIP